MTPEQLRLESLAYRHATDGCPYDGTARRCPACNPITPRVAEPPAPKPEAPAEFCVSPEVQAMADALEAEIERQKNAWLRVMA